MREWFVKEVHKGMKFIEFMKFDYFINQSDEIMKDFEDVSKE